jgi:hypothetical protein
LRLVTRTKAPAKKDVQDEKGANVIRVLNKAPWHFKDEFSVVKKEFGRARSNEQNDPDPQD